MPTGAATGKFLAFDAGYLVVRDVHRIVGDFVHPGPHADVVGLEFIASLYRHSSSK